LEQRLVDIDEHRQLGVAVLWLLVEDQETRMPLLTRTVMKDEIEMGMMLMPTCFVLIRLAPVHWKIAIYG
jgi:hypothetical protein